MALTINGKKVLGYALGDTEFYSIDKNSDGSISVNGNTYELKWKLSNSFACSWGVDPPYHVSISLNQKLSSGSDLTVKDLIDKGEQIRLTLTFHNMQTNHDSSLDSGIIDFSKPDSNGHFNFQWVEGTTSTNTYCCSDSGQFITYSDALEAYSSNYYNAGHIVIGYTDAS